MCLFERFIVIVCCNRYLKQEGLVSFCCFPLGSGLCVWFLLHVIQLLLLNPFVVSEKKKEENSKNW